MNALQNYGQFAEQTQLLGVINDAQLRVRGGVGCTPWQDAFRLIHASKVVSAYNGWDSVAEELKHAEALAALEFSLERRNLVLESLERTRSLLFAQIRSTSFPPQPARLSQ